MASKADTTRTRDDTGGTGRGAGNARVKEGLGDRFAQSVKRLWSRQPALAEARALPAGVDDDAEDLLFAEEEPNEVWLQRLWGPGFLTPGGKDHVITLVRELQLSAEVSLLELEPGLGGSTRAIAREYGAYVTAFESSPSLAAQAMDLSNKSGFVKKAEIQPFDPHAPNFKKTHYDHAFVKDGMVDIADIDDLLRAIQKALRPKGQFIISQFLKIGDAPIDTDHAVLAKPGSAPVGLRNKDQMVYFLGKAGFSITNADVTSATIRSEIARSWAAFAETLKTQSIDSRYGAKVLAECAQWVRVSAMLEDGTLEHVTIRAKRP